MCECASSNAIFTSVGWATLYTTTKTTNFFKSTIQCFWVYGHSVAVPPHLRERFLFSMPLSISSGCLFLAVKLKSLVLFFRQGRRSFSFLRVCLPLFMSLYLSVPPPLVSLRFFESTPWDCRGGDGDWLKHTVVSTFTFHLCFDNTFTRGIWSGFRVCLLTIWYQRMIPAMAEHTGLRGTD